MAFSKKEIRQRESQEPEFNALAFFASRRTALGLVVPGMVNLTGDQERELVQNKYSDVVLSHRGLPITYTLHPLEISRFLGELLLQDEFGQDAQKELPLALTFRAQLEPYLGIQDYENYFPLIEQGVPVYIADHLDYNRVQETYQHVVKTSLQAFHQRTLKGLEKVLKTDW